MKDQSLRVLMVEDSEDDELLLIRELKKSGYNPVYERVETAAAMKKALKEKQWDIILCDYQMPKFNAPSAIALLKETNIDIPVIIVSGSIGEEKAIECMRLGAHDYVMKDSLSRLCPAIARELKEAEVRNKQRQAENALRESEKKHRTILENIKDGYYEVDIKGNFTFFNNSMCRILGYSEEEMMGMNNRQITDKENAKKVFQAFNKVYKTGESAKEFNWQIIRKDGTKRYIEVSVSLQKNSSGKPIGFRGVTRDITERKKVEELLKKSEEQYRLLADNMTEHIWLMDLNTIKTIYVSPSVEKMYGYTSDEIIKLSLKKFLTAESLQKMLDSFSTEMPKALANPPPYVHKYSLELEACHKDGHLLWIENTLSIIRDENGKPAFMLGETRDITERKRVEEKLQNDQQELHAIMDASPIGVSWSDMQGNIKYTNHKFQEIFGYTVEEIPNIDAWLLLAYPSPAYREHVLSLISVHIEAQTQGTEANPIELTVVCKNGSIRHVLQTMLFTSNRILVIYYDITERKRAEDVLQQTLASLKKAVGTTIQVLVSAVEVRDSYTAGHQARTADLARAIATDMGLAQEKIDGIRMAGAIHDIGKLSIPAEILSKPSNLTNIEFSLVKEHSQSGYEMLKNVESPWPLAQIVYQHHERMNGSGYPRNLKGDEIILEARIMAVADVVEAMASHRPYRAALGIKAALEEIEKNKGILYDNAVADVCLRLFRKKGYILVLKKS